VLKNKQGIEEKATVIDWKKEGKFIIELVRKRCDSKKY